MASDVDGGPGWVIDGRSLRPVVTDLELFRAGIADDPLRDAIELLWTARPAEAERLLSAMDQTLRVRALRADCHREMDVNDRAVAEYEALVQEVRGTPSEPVMRQHYGKALLAAGRPCDALNEFRHALAQRRAAGADRAAVESSEQAVAAAMEACAGQAAEPD